MTTFLSWYVLFVEACGDFADLATLFNAQLTCKHVCLLMAQNRTFQKHFFRIQPFDRRFSAPEERMFAAARAGEEEEAEEAEQSLAGVRSEEADLRAMLWGDDAAPAAGGGAAAGAPCPSLLARAHPTSNWKVIARRYQRQLGGVACRVSTPHFFRGVWRMPERAMWEQPALALTESPPFFMQPRARRSRSWALRQSAITHEDRQGFQLIVQRTSRMDGNALGVFLQNLTPMEEEGHEVLFCIATLDRSLVARDEYRPIRRLAGKAQFTPSNGNSGFVFTHGKVTRFRAPQVRPRDDERAHGEPDPALATLEDICLEVEVFSLGPGITEPQAILSYPLELAAALDLPTRLLAADAEDGAAHRALSADGTHIMTLPMRASIWRALRDIQHVDPYTGQIMKLRTRMLRHLMPALLRDMDAGSEDLMQQASSSFWNMSDVAEPPIERAHAAELVRIVVKHIRDDYLSVAADENDDEEEEADEAAARARWRRRHNLRWAVPSLLGCLWNLPVSVDLAIKLFCNDSLADFLRLLVELIRGEMEVDAAARAGGGGGEEPITSLLFACCHFVSRAIFYLRGVERVRRQLDALDAEAALSGGTAVLVRRTRTMNSLGVSLFARDYCAFFLPLLSRRSSRACLEFAQFGFGLYYLESG